MEKCKYLNKYGGCNGQKDAPKCRYDLHENCEKFRPKSGNIGINVNVGAELNWEKICRYLVFTYQLDENEIGRYLKEHLIDYVNVTTL